MLAEKDTLANLSVYQPNMSTAQDFIDDLAGPSKVARWRIRYWIVATCAAAVDLIFDQALLNLIGIAEKARYGTLPWYVAKMKEFQYGDQLTLIDLEWKYAVVNEANRVIKLCAAKEGTGIVLVKIATIVSGVKQPLPTLQYNAAKAYLLKIKPAGIRVNLINDNPDDLILHLIINYDPLVMTDQGELIASPGVFPVEDAREEYLQNVDFNNGAYELMSAVDTIQKKKAQGVVSAYVTDAQARYGVLPFVSFDQRYFPNAGYLAIHPSSTITYVASV